VNSTFDEKSLVIGVSCTTAVLIVNEDNLLGTQLERKIRDITVRVTARENETASQLYRRLDAICKKIEELESDKERLSWIGSVSQEVNDAQSKTRHLFNLSDRERGEIGLTDDYHMVILSLLKNFDRCMGATAIAEEWKINSGRVSRVFTASRRKFEVYKGHFEKCKDGGGYQFTKVGLDYALARGVPEILDVGLEDEQDT
jgi:hypothetical protein